MAATLEVVAQQVKIPARYLCPITHQIMVDPVVAADGHTYEREAIEEWLKTQATSPKTNLKLKHKELIENHDKRGDILEFLEQHSELYEGEEVYLAKSQISGLVAAIKTNKTKEVQEYLARDRRLLTLKLERDYTAFHLACQFGSLELANILLESLSKRGQLDKILAQSPAGFKAVHLNVVLQLLQKQTSRIIELEKEVAKLKQQTAPEEDRKKGMEREVSPALLTLQFQAQLKSTQPKLDLKVSAEEAQKFLNHIARGEQNKAEAMLKKNRGLAVASGKVTDYAKRTFKNITGFQYAVWALDWHMWRMIRKYLPNEAAQEQAKGFTEGSWVAEHGKHVNWRKLTDAQQALLVNWDLWSWERANECWCKQIGVGAAQGLLPIHVLQEYGQPDRAFDPCPKFDTGYVLSRRNYLTKWCRDFADFGIEGGVLIRGDMPSLTQMPSVAKYSMDDLNESCTPVDVYVRADRQALVTLFNTRTQQRAALVAELVKKPGASPTK